MKFLAAKSIKTHIFLLIILSLVTSIYVQWPILSDYYSFDGDTSNIIFWHNSISLDKASINSNDLMSRYASWFIAPGLKAVYLLGSIFAEPIVLAKFIPIATSTICVILIYLIGSLMNGAKCGIVAAISFICTAWFYRYRQMFGSADAEEFSLVLMLLFIYFIIKEKYWILAIIIALEALFYPPLFILSSLTVFLSSLFRLRRMGTVFWKENKSAFTCMAVVILAFACFMFYKYQQSTPQFLGRTLTPIEVKDIDDFKPGGRNPIFSQPDTFSRRFVSDATGLGIDLPKKIMFGFICLLFVFPCSLKVRRAFLLKIPAVLWIFLVAGMGMCLIANLVLFKLYEPSRFIQNPLNIFLVLFIGCQITFGEGRLNVERRVAVRNVVAVAYLLVMMLVLVPRFGCHQETASSLKSEIDFISNLPGNAFVAGDPKLMNNLGLYAKKRVFLTYKLSTEVYWLNYYREMTKRTEDFYRTYYADSHQDVSEFCTLYGITHLVVDKSQFSDNYIARGDFYYSPFNDYIKQITAGLTSYFLMNLPPGTRIFEGLNIVVVDCIELSKTGKI